MNQRISPFAKFIIKKNGKLILKSKLTINANACIEIHGGTVSIGENTFINRNCILSSMDGIYIGNGTAIGPNVLIYDHDHIFGKDVDIMGNEYKSAKVVIGDNVWIGANVIILRGAEIGNNSVIAAGTVVKEKYPSNVLIKNKQEIEIKGI